MTDMTLDEAVSTVARFSKMFEAVQVLAGAVDDAKKIDTLTQEAEQRRASRAADADAAEAKLNDLNKKIDEAIARDAANAGKLSADAQAEASRTIEKARFEAQSILAQAEKMAADTRAKAQADVDPLVAKAAQASSDWSDLDGKLTAGRKELQELQAKIDQARDTIAQLMKV